MRVLLVGVGGTGNALAMSLASLKLERLGLADMDWVEVGNLSRQFLFGTADVGKMKVTVAAQKLKQICQNIEEFCCPIQSISDFTLSAYNVFILATDNLESRVHLNQRLFDLWKGDKLSDFLLVDTGSDGMRGHVQIVRPGTKFACLACSAELYQAETEKLTNHCTANHKPKTFAECVQLAMLRTENGDLHAVHGTAVKIADEQGIANANINETRAFMKGTSVNFAAVNAVIAGLATQLIIKIHPENNLFSVNLAYGCQIESLAVDSLESCSICHKNDTFELQLTPDSSVSELLSKMNISEGKKTMLYSKEDRLLFDSSVEQISTKLTQIFPHMSANQTLVMSKGKPPFWITLHLSPSINDR